MNIQGYPNYLIYDDGLVFSEKSNRFLKYCKNQYGYHMIILCKNGKQKCLYIHRLVATHYIPNPDNLPEIDHINIDKSDNRVQNLRWISHLDNCNNRGNRNDNTSGHKGLSYQKTRNTWKYEKTYHKKTIYKSFKTKTEALCYKYIILLKIKAGIF
jgi:hypothetical protein